MVYSICCDLFHNLLSIEGNEGLWIVPVHNPKFGNFFFLEFCAIPRSRIGIVELSKDEKVILSTRQAIKFCPFCGKNLADFYKRSFLQLPHVTEEECSMP